MVSDLNVLDDGGDQDPRCGNGLEKIYPTTAVRYGYMNYIGEFRHPPDMRFSCGIKVVIKTSRGIEIGQQVSLTCSTCENSVTREQIRKYLKNSGPEYYRPDSGRILREATPDDLREERHLRADTEQKRRFCQTAADRKKLPLKLVECEHLFGGERIVFYFLAEGRVDFRALVKEMAGEFQTRIEMRQVGVRDEARLLADYETCGRECCCKSFLKTLRPVSMKMAKMQKATLDPSKVSGRCGRLKCCLRYEHVGYEELDRKLPRMGKRVVTPHGEGVVVNRQILTQLIQVRTEDGEVFTAAIEDVESVGRPATPAGGPKPRSADQPPPPEPPPAPRPPQETATPQVAGTAEPPPADSEAGADPPRPRRRRRRRRGGPRRRGNGSDRPPSPPA